MANITIPKAIKAISPNVKMPGTAKPVNDKLTKTVAPKVNSNLGMKAYIASSQPKAFGGGKTSSYNKGLKK